tara:strand:- start:110 stop:952 length:843 start_codon:yes stop_codon:yes gene_type:complete
MNKTNIPEFSLYEFFDYIIKHKTIFLCSFLIPLFISLFYYFYQPRELEFHVDLITNNKLNYQSEEALSIQNININYQILRSINISRDLLVRMTENINPIGIISKNNYLMTLEDIINDENNDIVNNFKNLKSLSVLVKSDDHITLQFIFFDIEDYYKEISKINIFLNNKTLEKLKATFEEVNQQFKKLTEIGNLGSEDNSGKLTNELLFTEINKVFEKYKIFSSDENFFIDEKKTNILMLKKIKFKLGLVIIIPLLAILFVMIFLFIKASLQGYIFYRSGK